MPSGLFVPPPGVPGDTLHRLRRRRVDCSNIGVYRIFAKFQAR
jgi:hypothetical protein